MCQRIPNSITSPVPCNRQDCPARMSRPADTEQYTANNCPIWVTGPWRKCSGRCLGPATTVQRRSVICQHANGSLYTDCDLRDRPISARNCSSDPCDVQWHPWSVGVASSPAGWTVFTAGVAGRLLTSTVPGSYGPPPGNTATPPRVGANARTPPSSTPAVLLGHVQTDLVAHVHRTLTPPSGREQLYNTTKTGRKTAHTVCNGTSCCSSSSTF
ncbi:protein madd-4-like isoform X2 [Scophthalmus maximus]|uniref:protein madd-4-like isoform X2 n=1 Tax=Scophthalmus maximus TaxID=52904 RepID=UPI001FA8B4B1|nr:protein madd-4-like isoform X2 [Scophthalmus maximus]